MPKINLFNHIESRGIDAKSNPLLLGNKKLHLASNFLWDEGVMRTRYGFRYLPLGMGGQFQGACEFFPSKGISSQRLSEAPSGVTIVVEGNLFFNKSTNPCSHVAISDTSPFCGKGDVNLYEAENYVIIQNKNTETYWWDGFTLTKSPGLEEETWNDPEMPMTEIRPVSPIPAVPIAPRPNVRFTIINDDTEQLMTGAVVSLIVNTAVAYNATSADGAVSFIAEKRIYRYTVERAGFVSAIGEVDANQDALVVVRMKVPASPNPFLGLTVKLQYIAPGEACGPHTCNNAIFNIFGNGVFIGNANLNNSLDYVDGNPIPDPVYGLSPNRIASFLLTPEQSEQIAASSEDGESIVFTYACDIGNPLLDPNGWGGACHAGVGQLVVLDLNENVLYQGCAQSGGDSINVTASP